jgi:hypothetical protein
VKHSPVFVLKLVMFGAFSELENKGIGVPMVYELISFIGSWLGQFYRGKPSEDLIVHFALNKYQ